MVTMLQIVHNVIPHTLILHTNSGNSDLVSTSFGIDVTQHWW